jgi:glutathione peroxidase
MRTLPAALAPFILVAAACTAEAKAPDAKSGGDAVIDHVVKDIDGKEISLSTYRGKVALVVNVASECGFTPQYADLQKLYAQDEGRGLVVLGFPSNDFGGQEPGTPEEIKKFAHDEFGVTFPLFEKVHATGPDIAPLYKTLTTQTPFPGPVKWNFTKFLVDRSGHVVARFPSDTPPMAPDVITAIEGCTTGSRRGPNCDLLGG